MLRSMHTSSRALPDFSLAVRRRFPMVLSGSNRSSGGGAAHCGRRLHTGLLRMSQFPLGVSDDR